MFTEILYPFDTWKECLDFNSDALEDFNKDKKTKVSDLSDSFSKTELKLETGSNISSHFKPCYSCGVGMGRKHGETMKSVLMFSNLSVYYNHMGSFFKTQIARPHASRIGWPHSFCTGRTAK